MGDRVSLSKLIQCQSSFGSGFLRNITNNENKIKYQEIINKKLKYYNEK